jgi:methyl-accepting chemotaxis protein
MKMKLFQLNTIGKKFLIPTLALTILLLGGIGSFMTIKNTESIKAMINSKGNVIADFIAKTSSQHYFNYDYESLEVLVQDLTKDPEIEYAVFYNDEGEALTESSTASEDASSLMVFVREIIDEDGINHGNMKIGYNTSNLSKIVRTSIMIVTVSIIVAIAVLFLGISAIVRTITRPIKELLQVFSEIAEGEGDLTKRLDIKASDEVGALAECFNRFLEKLHGIIGKVADVTDQVASSAEEVSASSAQIASGSEQQNSQTEQVASAMQEITASVVNVAQSSSEASASAKEATETASGGGEVVTQTIDGMNRIAQAVNDSAENIEKLGKSSEQIGEIIKVIDDIASQTNLLALNAAIEAARAGEQGRGFAVVADEVRKLAERTTAATQEIGEMIKGIQNDTSKAVESMHAGTKEVDGGVELANNAGQSLKNILETVSKVTDMIQHIATAAEQQSSAGEEISSTVESVANVSRETSESAAQSSKASRHLSSLADELQHLVGGFKLRNNGDRGGVAVPEGESHHASIKSA